MIEAKNLKKIYKTKKGVVVKALDGVSAKLPDTGMVFILGKSGSGKSTLLNVLGGLDSFDSGEIIIKGTSAKDFKQSHYDSYRNTYIGFIFQEYNILEELTVGANIALAIELQGRRATDDEVNSILKEVDLDGYGARKPNELSGGQKQRVAIARALVKKPEIIMADEPTGALDSVTGKQVFDTLKKLSRDKLVLIVSHDREFSEQYADRIIELKDGVIISDVEKDSESEESFLSCDESIVFAENEIQVKAGYTITEEDRIAINEYLSALSSGATIKLSNGKKRITSGDFKPTDEKKIKSDKAGDFKLIKSKLSLKNAFKLGSSALKYKKVRLVITIFLSLISFTLFGLADTIAAYDNVKTATNSIYDTGVDYASYIKSIKYTSGDYSYWGEGGTLLGSSDVSIIKDKTGKNVVGVYKKDVQLTFEHHLGSEKVEGFDPTILFSGKFSGLTVVDNTLISENGFELLGSSRLPEADKNEILVTKYTYEYFKNVGYIGQSNEGRYEKEINNYDDLIGVTLNLDVAYNDSNNFTIVGIIDTNFDYSRYEQLASSDAEHNLNFIEIMALQSELDGIKNYSFASIGFVHSSFMDYLIAELGGKPENTSGYGNFHILIVKDDSANDESELWGEDKENVVNSTWFQYLNKLENVKDKVVWSTPSPLESLSDNQIIISTNYLRELISNSNQSDALYDPEQLVGFEATLMQKYKSGEWSVEYPLLSNILSNPVHYAAWKYATDPQNLETVKQISAQKARDFGYSEDDISDLLNKPDSLYEFFVNYRNDEISDSYVKEYLDSLTETYGLSDFVISEELKDMLITSITYDGQTYYSYDRNLLNFNFQLSHNLDELILNRYIFENFADAEKYFDYRNSLLTDDKEYTRDFRVITGMYRDYIRNKDGYVSTASETYEEFTLKQLLKLYNAIPAENKMIITLNSYTTGKSAFVKNVEIVGVISEEESLKWRGVIVVGDSLMSDMFGANLGGVYSYAVGVMPESKSDIRELVSFTDRYVSENGEVKYKLKNNVTDQLSMVDELLDVLGKVFLYVGLGFAVFASLMLANFISTSVTYKKQDIGILRAIGSRSADVFRIFFAEAFIIAMINYILSVAGTGVVTFFINGALRNDAGLLITFLNFGIRQIGLLLLVSLGVALIATFLPVKKIASMKPIDAIKNRK
ncbi:MAG: ATP-binding cassette domain-containing protein [Ruminococcaceae bacterium]|nr:ATP-binding cassette domain-containing protein [Oscillospiraceae bacterium]